MSVSLEIRQHDAYSPQLRLGPYRRSDYDALIGDDRHELLFGWLYVAPAPIVRHQILVSLVYEVLLRAAKLTGGIALFAPVDVVLSDHTVVQPDLLHLGPQKRGPLGRAVEEVPDLLVEVLSPATTRRDRMEKFRWYAAAGVSEYWIVDGEGQHVDFFRLEDGCFVPRYPRNDVYRSDLVPDIEIDLPSFWQEAEERVGGKPVA